MAEHGEMKYSSSLTLSHVFLVTSRHCDKPRRGTVNLILIKRFYRGYLSRIKGYGVHNCYGGFVPVTDLVIG